MFVMIPTSILDNNDNAGACPRRVGGWLLSGS